MTEPNFIIEHRIKFVDSGLRARLDGLEATVGQLNGRMNAMATAQETIEAELAETEAKAQAALDASTAVGEVVSDLRALVEELQASVGNSVSQEVLDAWKARSDAMQEKLDAANANLAATLSPPSA